MGAVGVLGASAGGAMGLCGLGGAFQRLDLFHLAPSDHLLQDLSASILTHPQVPLSHTFGAEGMSAAGL